MERRNAPPSEDDGAIQLGHKTGLIGPYTHCMGNTLTAPPIYRLIAWWRHRQTLCTVCHKAPKVTAADGDDRYCSEDCAEWDGWMQAHG